MPVFHANRIAKSEKRRAPERAELKTIYNPLGLPEKRGFNITKQGYKKAPREELIKPKPNIVRKAAYGAYKRLKERPEGMRAFEKDEQKDGCTIVKHGEVFCRVEIETGVLCHKITQFSDTGNLRHHVKLKHHMEVAREKVGAKSLNNVEELEKWYKNVMVEHDKCVQMMEDNEGDSLGSFFEKDEEMEEVVQPIETWTVVD